MNVVNSVASPSALASSRLPIFRGAGEPEQYRLVPSRAFFKRVLSSLPVVRIGFPHLFSARDYWKREVVGWNLLTAASLQTFRFRTRLISGTGTPVSSLHHHILRLRIVPSRLHWLIQGLLSLLPARCRSWAKSVIPEWFLPETVILKPEKDTGEEGVGAELFDTEVEAYARLSPLQGTVTPVCYGQARYNGRRALILQDVDGKCIHEPEGLTLSLYDLSNMLHQCYSALHACGVHQEDPQLNNFVLADNRLVALDFERVAFDLSEEERACFTESGIHHLANRYAGMQASFRRQGLLEAA